MCTVLLGDCCIRVYQNLPLAYQEVCCHSTAGCCADQLDATVWYAH